VRQTWWQLSCGFECQWEGLITGDVHKREKLSVVVVVFK
jgi:hypothetical protein